MEEKSMYFAKNDIYEQIRAVGGTWNDGKERPIVCLIKSLEKDGLYWAIPVGNWNHRNPTAKERIEGFINLPSKKIESCYYHLGKTTTQSIFFISDVIPITDKYIDRGYLGRNQQTFQIKNKPLIKELERKLRRILSYENANPNHFRQHITDIKSFLIQELSTQ